MVRQTVFFVLAGLCATSSWASPEQVARVLAGELHEARASWWGFDTSDATRSLQAAIQSRVPKLIVDNMGAPWITDKLTLVSDQEILFEPGAEVLAKQGCFLGKSDSLFSLVCVSNVTLRGPGATLRMRRGDYDAPPYDKAEWRHVLTVKSCSNIRVYGLTLAESGGDGIYLGCAKSGVSNVGIHIKDVICDKNYRQGISVITAENLLIENTVMRDTAGTAPAAGIDFEPNHSSERLKNCVLRDCVTENNHGDGYEFYLPNLTCASEPVSIRLENCRSSGDRTAVRVITGNADEEAVRGTMVFSGCRFERSLKNGVTVGRKPAQGMALTFERCVVAGCAEGSNTFSDLLFSNRIEDEFPVGGIRLDGVTVVQPLARPWLAWQNNTTVAEPLSALSGRVTVEQGGTKQEIALTPEWVSEKFPPRFNVRVPRVAVDFARVRAVEAPGAGRKLSPLRLRRGGHYLVYGWAGREVLLVGQHSRVGRYVAETKPLKVRGPSGKVVETFPLPGFGARAEFRFLPKEEGVHFFEVEVGGNAFILHEANVPVAFDTTRKAVGLIGSAGSLYVPVPERTGVFAFGVAGEGEGEAVKLSVIDPEGRTVWSKDGITQMERYTASEGQGAKGGLWQLKIERPRAGGFEDFHLEALGVPGCLFLSPERYWVVGR